MTRLLNFFFLDGTKTKTIFDLWCLERHLMPHPQASSAHALSPLYVLRRTCRFYTFCTSTIKCNKVIFAWSSLYVSSILLVPNNSIDSVKIIRSDCPFLFDSSSLISNVTNLYRSSSFYFVNLLPNWCTIPRTIGVYNEGIVIANHPR